jgi:hypothetical protein
MSSSIFKPIFPNHAIERCSATFAFRDALPDKLFTELKNIHDPLIRKSGFRDTEFCECANRRCNGPDCFSWKPIASDV